MSSWLPPLRPLRGRIHSQDHRFQAFDWQSLFGHFLGQVHQPGGGEEGRVMRTKAPVPSGEGTSGGRLGGQRLPCLPSCLSSGPAPPPHILPEPKGWEKRQPRKVSKEAPSPSVPAFPSSPRVLLQSPLEGRVVGGWRAVVGRSVKATGLGASCKDGVWGVHGIACQRCRRPWH